MLSEVPNLLRSKHPTCNNSKVPLDILQGNQRSSAVEEEAEHSPVVGSLVVGSLAVGNLVEGSPVAGNLGEGSLVEFNGGHLNIQ